eukprot:TRINITY_DN29248_c0_g1_i1.p1 TRINITY_DN29248_c0_g1~~TRINITY_DN29248_c0_g1_i1.p1  ORF type:complete len:305 (+),score=45.53 TRINITY_DN29248_c0_g1_i1:43-957(+)
MRWLVLLGIAVLLRDGPRFYCTMAEDEGPKPLTVDGIIVPDPWVKGVKNILHNLASPGQVFQERNADLSRDPKLMEIESTMASCGADGDHSLGDHMEAARIRSKRREGVEFSDRLANRLSREALQRTLPGRDPGNRRVTDWLAVSQGSRPLHISDEMRALFSNPAAGASSPSSFSASVASGEDPMSRPLRRELGRSMTRLVTDMDLAMGDMLSHATPELRCGHVDRMHAWLRDHKPKEVFSSAKTPSYLNFSKDEPIMTGSLLTEPHERRFAPLPWSKPAQRPAWMDRGSRHNASAPSLFEKRH